MDARLQTYLKNDRQWPRMLRIDHARYRLANSLEDIDKDYDFWQAVIEANSLPQDKKR